MCHSKTDTPRIYVACLAAYNNGVLHGTWTDATQDSQLIVKEVKHMLAASPMDGAEEWVIHDYEGFGSLRLSEWVSFEKVSALAQFIEQHPDYGAELLSYFCGDLNEAQKAAENYFGTFDSLADYAEQEWEDVFDVPEAVARYIDYYAIARDMELGGDVFTLNVNGCLHVFQNW